MKRLRQIILILFIAANQIAAQNTEEQWDTYIALYEDEKPGSTTLRMDLINETPIQDYDFVLITGITYNTSLESGFPEEETFKVLHKVENELVELISKEVESIEVGSFMHNSERLEYFYIKNPKNIQTKIEAFYKKNYPQNKFYINIEEDKEWKYYKDFLYPNEEILNYMTTQNLLLSFQEAGDDLTKERRVDHWLYFSNEDKMRKCKEEVKKLNFNIQSSEINKETELPFELQIWRIDKIDIDSIFSITSKLSEIAKRFNGNYDGWEASVEKE